MKHEPSEYLDPRARLLWRLTGAVQAAVVALAVFGISAGGLLGSGASTYLSLIHI